MTNHAFGAMALRLSIGSKHNAQTVLAMAVTRSCTRDIVVAERWFNPSSPMIGTGKKALWIFRFRISFDKNGVKTMGKDIKNPTEVAVVRFNPTLLVI